jgi:septum site-determining protein MinC
MDVVKIKGSVFSISMLQVLDADLEKIDQSLAEKVKKSSGFFRNAPIIIDVLKVAFGPANLTVLIEILRKYEFVSVGVISDDEELREYAGYAGLALFKQPASNRTIEPDLRPVEQSQSSEPTITGSSNTVLVKQTVRSGQQIYAKNADLIVTAAVNAGAEIMADGNIHVYGQLRGKALAGIGGDEKSQIFVQKLSAELICIAGVYSMTDQIAAEFHQKAVKISLKDKQLKFSPLR